MSTPERDSAGHESHRELLVASHDKMIQLQFRRCPKVTHCEQFALP